MVRRTTHVGEREARAVGTVSVEPAAGNASRPSSVPPLLPRTRSGIYRLAASAPDPFRLPPNPIPRLEVLPTLDDDDEDEEDTVPIRRLERVDLESVIARVSSTPPPPTDARTLEVPAAPPERPSLRAPDPFAHDEEGLPWRHLGHAAALVAAAIVITAVGRGTVLLVDRTIATASRPTAPHLTSVHREATTMRTFAMPTQLFATRSASEANRGSVEPGGPSATPSSASEEPPFVGPPFLPEPPLAEAAGPEPHEPLPAPSRGDAEATPAAPRRESDPSAARTDPVASEDTAPPPEEALAEDAEAVAAAAEMPVDPEAAALAARLDPPPREAPLASLPTREEVARALRALGPSVNACSTATSVVEVRLVFASDGSVSTVDVSDPGTGATDRSCVESVLRTARIPPFARPSFSTGYVYTHP